MLTLLIKKKWLDMILSGEKQEEYREIKPYYSSRFRSVWGYPAYWGEEHEIRFRSGYRPESPTVIAMCTLSSGQGRPEWGAVPGEKYYRLHIRRVIPEGITGETGPSPTDPIIQEPEV